MRKNYDMRSVVIVFFCCISFLLYFNRLGVAEDAHPVPEYIERLLDEGKFDEARVKLHEFRRTAPDNPRAILYIARLETDFKKALALFKEVEILADSSLASEAVLSQGEIHFFQQSVESSEYIFLRLVDEYPLTPASAKAHYFLGMIKLISSRPDEAGIHFKRCLEHPANDDQTLAVFSSAGIMECHAALKDWEKVIESARVVLERDSNNIITPRVLEVIAYSWRELGNSDNSNHYTERLLKNYPDSYQAHAIRVRAGSIISDPGLAVDVEYTPDDKQDTSLSENAEFTIQASAFVEKNNALKLYKRLQEAGFKSHLAMKTVADKHYYLVQVGYFETREKAADVAERVTEFTGIKAHVISLAR